MGLGDGDLYGLYNGKDVANLYAIGAATRPDGSAWTKYGSNPVLQAGTAGTWDDGGVKDPWLLHIDGAYVMYYSGYDGSTYRIGRATAASHEGPWTKYASNPVLDLGTGGSFDDDGVAFARVLYEPFDAGREYKMWYSGISAADGKFRIGYAYSSDGISWTKHGMVIDVGAGGSWNDEGVGLPCPIKVGSTYCIFAAGSRGTTNPQAQGGLWTTSDPEGSYTPDVGNPLFLPRFNDAGTSQSLTADTGSGSAMVTVADTSAWNVGEPMALADGDSATHISEIASIDSGTQVTLEDVTVAAFTTLSGAVLRPLAWNSVGPSVVRGNATDGYEAWVTTIQPVEDLSVGGVKLREGSMRMTSSALTGPWSYDYTTGLVFALGAEGSRWDAISSENLSIVALTRFTPASFGAEAGFTSGEYGFEFSVGADVYLIPVRFGAEAGFTAGLSFRTTGSRQVMLTGNGIETPEMTTGGTTGQVLSFDEDGPPTWEDAAGTVDALDDVGDVDAAAPSDGDVLVWDDYLQAWVTASISTLGRWEPVVHDPDGYGPELVFDDGDIVMHFITD